MNTETFYSVYVDGERYEYETYTEAIKRAFGATKYGCVVQLYRVTETLVVTMFTDEGEE